MLWQFLKHIAPAHPRRQKSSAMPSPVGIRVSWPAASAVRNASVLRNLIELLQRLALLVNEQLGVTDNVDEQDMGDLESNV
jgi:hypothetical protein